MAEPNFTLGPWVVHQGDEVRGAGNELIVCDHGYEIPDDVAVANACLIAAAPELYDALVQCETVMMIVQPRSHTKEYLACLDWVRAALAKARGELPTEPFAHDEARHVGDGDG